MLFRSEGKTAPYIQNHPPRLHNRKERGKNGGNPVDPENRLSRSGADILIYGPRADVLMHHLCTSHSLICISSKLPSAIHTGHGICVRSHPRTLPVREHECPVREHFIPFASWFLFANGKDFCEHAKHLAWLWIKRNRWA